MKFMVFAFVIVVGLNDVGSSPSPFAKGGLANTYGEVDLGYNSTTSNEVVLDDVVLIVVNLAQVSNPNFNFNLHSGPKNKSAKGSSILEHKVPKTNTQGSRVPKPPISGSQKYGSQVSNHQSSGPQVTQFSLIPGQPVSNVQGLGLQGPRQQVSNVQVPGQQVSNVQGPGQPVPKLQIPLEQQITNVEIPGHVTYTRVSKTQWSFTPLPGPRMTNSQSQGSRPSDMQAPTLYTQVLQTLGTSSSVDSIGVVDSMSMQHSASNTFAVIDQLSNSTFNSTGSIVIGSLEPIYSGDPSMISGTCDSFQKEAKHLQDLETILLQLLNATRQQMEIHKNASSGFSSCFSEHNITQSNITGDELMNNAMKRSMTEPAISQQDEHNTLARLHTRKSLKDFTAEITSLINLLQGMGLDVTMHKDGMSSSGPSNGPSTSNSGHVDTVCGSDLPIGPSSLVNYVMGRHRR